MRPRNDGPALEAARRRHAAPSPLSFGSADVVVVGYTGSQDFADIARALPALVAGGVRHVVIDLPLTETGQRVDWGRGSAVSLWTSALPRLAQAARMPLTFHRAPSWAGGRLASGRLSAPSPIQLASSVFEVTEYGPGADSGGAVLAIADAGKLRAHRGDPAYWEVAAAEEDPTKMMRDDLEWFLSIYGFTGDRLAVFDSGAHLAPHVHRPQGEVDRYRDTVTAAAERAAEAEALAQRAATWWPRRDLGDVLPHLDYPAAADSLIATIKALRGHSTVEDDMSTDEILATYAQYAGSRAVPLSEATRALGVAILRATAEDASSHDAVLARTGLQVVRRSLPYSANHLMTALEQSPARASDVADALEIMVMGLRLVAEMFSDEAAIAPAAKAQPVTTRPDLHHLGQRTPGRAESPAGVAGARGARGRMTPT